MKVERRESERVEAALVRAHEGREPPLPSSGWRDRVMDAVSDRAVGTVILPFDRFVARFAAAAGLAACLALGYAGWSGLTPEAVVGEAVMSDPDGLVDSATVSVTVTANAPQSSDGGGGMLSLWLLALLLFERMRLYDRLFAIRTR